MCCVLESLTNWPPIIQFKQNMTTQLAGGEGLVEAEEPMRIILTQAC